MVNYYFGSKQGLFAEVMHLALTPSTVVGRVLAGPAASPEKLAERLIRTLLAVWENPAAREPLMSMLEHSIGDEAIKATVAEFLGKELSGQITEYIGGPDASVRAAGVISVLSGIIFARYVMRIAPIADITPQQLLHATVPMVALHLRRGATLNSR